MKNFVSRAGLAASVALGTLMVSVPAFAAEEIATENPYGLRAALEQGGPIAQGTFGILVLMSLTSWYVIFTKWWDQRKLLIEAKELDKKFWSAPSLKDGAAKLDKNSAFRQIVDDGLRAADHHEGRLTDSIDKNEWVTMSMARSTHAINARLQSGLAWLASVGSTSPFVGLFGTVVGIYRALINIGVAGQASIDKVAGPVGEALIMTALGLAVAVPAVLGYNWLIRRNKDVQDRLNNFSADVHGYMMSGARVARTGVTPTAAPKA
ncbi:MotA/TolQ/ExbB proton channel family protein [Sphingosinicella microcystinivorans]|uniref:Biopolymer transport protein ExbB n=1 Tax=Sphingosinicella microcystinivorans TaxID=335406 RepID=A0AAD1D7C1_SPHMI|nr:outer membrane transport energization protein ExbB [Sphingosinicella microcystinivorans]BBE35166.1 biopolymer transporter ExbB [Sphingosinicella microcystinivorans]